MGRLHVSTRAYFPTLSFLAVWIYDHCRQLDWFPGSCFPGKILRRSTVAILLRLHLVRLLVLRTFDLSFDLPDDSLVHDVLDVSSALTENKVCSGFEHTDNKVASVLLESSLRNRQLKH